MARFTDEQLAAIEARGKTIVSASAGSGKTTVMIEKIIRLIESGTSVSEILAVTYTKKAAAQMKEKLRKKLIEAINAQGVSKERRQTLKKQLAEVPGADISTIHSFCSNLIRSHFFAAGVDSRFGVIMDDDAEAKALKNKALDLVFDEAYESGEKSFSLLLSVFFRSKSDNALRKIFNELYDELRIRADYKEYLRSASEKFNESVFEEICGRLYGGLKEKCRYYRLLVENELAFFEVDGKPPFQEEIEGAKKRKDTKAEEERAALILCRQLDHALAEIENAPDYFSACAVQKPAFEGAERKRKTDSDERRAHVEKLSVLKAKIEDIFSAELSQTKSREEEFAAFLRSGEVAVALSEYLLKFDEKYSEGKRERGVLDCADLEHFTLKLLAIPSIAAEVRGKYKYLFVDEYQDVNPVQEQILSAIAGDEVFLVGDVKQSIYGFRGSRSQFFLDKQSEYDLSETAKSLYLTRNFRSSDKVLEAVNAQFDLAMTTATGSVDYKKTSRMERGGLYEEESGRVEIHFVEEEKTAREKKPRGVYSVRENAGKKDKTLGALAKRVKYIVERERSAKWYDSDGKNEKFKRVEYSDIAILSRRKKGKITEIVDALAAEGVPVSAPSGMNICEYPEIKTLIDILSYIDNEEQDVPLCSALLSTTELTEDDLSKIRLAYPTRDKNANFRSACKRYALEQKDLIAYRLNKFYAYFEKIRTLSAVMDAGELLAKIIAETQMEARLLARENGTGCLKRIRRFLEETTKPEPLCVCEFLERLRNLDYEVDFIENGGEGAVRVLTMHASKGLEFPIVILDNLNEPFYKPPKTVLIDEDYALAPRAYDVERATYSSTLLRRLCEKKAELAEKADELNLYYVALTRAKYGLHLLFSKRTALPDVRYARSFADFTDFSVWEKYVVEDGVFELPYQERQALVQLIDERLSAEIVGAIGWQYPYGGYENLPVKKSATGLLTTGVGFAERFGRDEAKLQTGDFAAPSAFAVDERTETVGEFASEGKAGSGRAIEEGIAYHAFLENFDFSLLYDERGGFIDDEALKSVIASELARMNAQKALSDESFALLSEKQLFAVLKNPAFAGLWGMRLYRERQFLAGLTANEVLALRSAFGGELGETEFEAHPLGDGETVLFQGAIDLLAVSDEGDVRVIDYKYSVGDAEYLKNHYALQLALYRKVTARIMKLPLEKIRCTIVNIYRGFEVEMDGCEKD